MRMAETSRLNVRGQSKTLSMSQEALKIAANLLMVPAASGKYIYVAEHV